MVLGRYDLLTNINVGMIQYLKKGKPENRHSHPLTNSLNQLRYDRNQPRKEEKNYLDKTQKESRIITS